MVWMALTLVTLTAFAGLGLEYGRWNNLSTRIQKAADAAALAGAIFMPENVGNKAFNTAKTTASYNGFTNGTAGVTIFTAAGKLPNQLKVTISVPTKNPWGQLVGYNSTHDRSQRGGRVPASRRTSGARRTRTETTPSRSARSRSSGETSSGRRRAREGRRDPVGRARRATRRCATPTTVRAVSTRTTTRTATSTASTCRLARAGALNVDIFDPAFVHVGDNCGNDATDANAVASLNAAATLTAASIPGYPGTITPAERYASGSGQQVLHR